MSGRKRRNEPSFAREAKIQIKSVPGLPCFVVRPTAQKVRRWYREGVYGVYLEGKREGKLIYTSAEAVHRFLERTQ